MDDLNQTLTGQSPQTSVQPPIVAATPQPQQPKEEESKFSLILVLLILIIAVSAASYYYLILSKQTNKPVNVAQTISKPTSTPTPTIDPTANWKTLEDKTNGFTIKYPANWNILAVGGTKVAEQTLQEYVTETENALSGPGLPPIKIIPSDNASKRQTVTQKEIIIKETKNKVLGNVLIAYILKDTITVITIQVFPSNRNALDKPFSNQEKELFDQILSTLKFTN
ncbi:MAG: hypothetical protein Q8P10_01455 [bacterium]|nr:hypothetical protein [bacterium]